MRERAPLAAVLGVFGVAVVVLTVAWLGKDRSFFASVPQPPPLEQVQLIPLKPAQTACLRDITILHRSRIAILHIGTDVLAEAPR